MGLLHITITHCLSPEEFSVNTTAPLYFTLVFPSLGWASTSVLAGGVWHRIKVRSDPDCRAGVCEILPVPDLICFKQNKIALLSPLCLIGHVFILRNYVLAVRWFIPLWFVPKQSIFKSISQMTKDLSKAARRFWLQICWSAGVYPCWSCACVGFHQWKYLRESVHDCMQGSKTCVQKKRFNTITKMQS